MNFAETCNRIFWNTTQYYHRFDQFDAPLENPYSEGSIEYYLCLKNWIDVVQWHLEDIIRNPEIDPEEALAIKRRIDKSNQERTDLVEMIDDYFDNLGDKLQHIHFNDRGHTVPGDGDFPMKEYYDSIKNRGYDGTVSFEICDRRYYRDPDKAIDDIVAWMKANTNEFD